MQAETQRTGARTILFAHYGNDWIRGSEQCLLDLVKHLDRSRFRSVVLCNSPMLARAAEALGARALVHPAITPAGLFEDRPAVKQLTEFARREGVHLVHANTSMLVPRLLPVVRKLRIPILAQLHIVPTALERRHQLLHQLSMVVGVSQTSVEGFAAEGMDARKVRVIYNGVDGARLSNGDATGLRRQLRIPDGATVLGAIGSLIHRKGVDMLVSTTRVLRDAGNNVHLLIAGDGEERSALEQQAKNLGIDGVVHFLGERRDAGAILRDSVDIAVSASRGEAFPLSVLEAAYFGRPIVVSNIPPHHEGVVDGETGLIVDTNNAVAFAARLSELIANPDRIRKIGDAAQRRVRQDFSLAKNVQRFQEVYDELIEQQPRGFGWVGGTVWPREYSRWLRQAILKRIGF